MVDEQEGAMCDGCPGIVPAIEKWRQEGQEPKVTLSYIGFDDSPGYTRLCLVLDCFVGLCSGMHL